MELDYEFGSYLTSDNFFTFNLICLILVCYVVDNYRNDQTQTLDALRFYSVILLRSSYKKGS